MGFRGLRPFEGKGSRGARLFCHRPPEDAKGAMLECPQCQRAASNRRGRVVLVEPGLRQHLVAVAQEAAQVDRLVALDRQVELGAPVARHVVGQRSEAHTSELQSLMRLSYAVLCLKKK